MSPAGSTPLDPDVNAAAVVIPIKSFEFAKTRLAGTLSKAKRARLARALATQVVEAAHPLPAFVVCDDHEVADWASSVGATSLWRPGPGLDQAVTDGVIALAERGHHQAIVAHGDLPLARELAWVADFAGVTIVPDRHGQGTNVLSVPTDAGFVFAYGLGSFRRHAAQARACGLPLRICRDRALGWDVDHPDDLDHPDINLGGP